MVWIWWSPISFCQKLTKDEIYGSTVVLLFSDVETGQIASNDARKVLVVS